MYDLPVEKALAMKKPDASWPLKRCNDWEYKLSFSDVPYVSVAAEMNWVTRSCHQLGRSIGFWNVSGVKNGEGVVFAHDE